MDIRDAARQDAGELLTLQRACWVQEAIANDTLDIPPLRETLDEVEESLSRWSTWVLRRAGRLVGSVRGRLVGGPQGECSWEIGRLMVAPDRQGSGLGRALLAHAEARAPEQARRCTLFTGLASHDNLRMYLAAGFCRRDDLPAPPGTVVLTKTR